MDIVMRVGDPMDRSRGLRGQVEGSSGFGLPTPAAAPKHNGGEITPPTFNVVNRKIMTQ